VLASVYSVLSVSLCWFNPYFVYVARMHFDVCILYFVRRSIIITMVVCYAHVFYRLPGSIGLL
jgi:hypothetical protein